MDINVDPDKIIAAVLTSIAVKLGEKGYAYLKRVYANYRLKKSSQCNITPVMLGSDHLLKKLRDLNSWRQLFTPASLKKPSLVRDSELWLYHTLPTISTSSI